MNRKDAEGRNVFQGGFLGLDNIGVFDRSAPLPTGGHIEQADGTGWMAMYCLNLLAIAMELASEDPAYEDVASKFWEHFLYIANAINHLGDDGVGMWDEEDGFFYDVLHMPDGGHVPLKIRSMVGLIPLFAVETLEPELIDKLPGFKRRMEWFIENRQGPDRATSPACRRRGRRAAAAVDCRRRPAAPRPAASCWTKTSFSRPTASARSRATTRTIRIVLPVDGREYRVDYEPARIDHRPVRRQFQLARADLVPGELSC